MASFATNIVTPAASVVTSLSSAVSTAQTLRNNLAANFPGTTLNNLATSTLSWRSDVGDLRLQLDSAISNLSVAAQQFAVISGLLGSIGSND